MASRSRAKLGEEGNVILPLGVYAEEPKQTSIYKDLTPSALMDSVCNTIHPQGRGYAAFGIQQNLKLWSDLPIYSQDQSSSSSSSSSSTGGVTGAKTSVLGTVLATSKMLAQQAKDRGARNSERDPSDPRPPPSTEASSLATEWDAAIPAVYAFLATLFSGATRPATTRQDFAALSPVAQAMIRYLCANLVASVGAPGIADSMPRMVSSFSNYATTTNPDERLVALTNAMEVAQSAAESVTNLPKESLIALYLAQSLKACPDIDDAIQNIRSSRDP